MDTEGPSTGRTLLASHPLFAGLDEQALTQLSRFLHVREVRKGAAIVRKGDPGASLMIVADGAVKVVAPSADGKEALLNVIERGGVFGEIALLDGEPRTADAIALADCTLLVLDRRDVLPFIHRHPQVAIEFISVLCRKLRQASEHVESMMFLSVTARMARALQRFRQGASVPLTQLQIAQAIGSTRESVNQELRRWQAEGWIRLEKGGLVILRDDMLDELARAR